MIPFSGQSDYTVKAGLIELRSQEIKSCMILFFIITAACSQRWAEKANVPHLAC